MTPYDPPAQPASEVIVEPRQPDAFWSWTDLALFISLTFLSVVATLTATAFAHVMHWFGAATELVLAQCLLYVLVILSLYLIIRLRYGRRFWNAMAISSMRPRWLAYLVAGMFLAIIIGLLGVLLRAREIPLPFQDMLRSRSAVISLGILVVFLGPFCEELVFRGFLLPLFSRVLGWTGGIVLAGVLFGALHGPEYQWSWQHVLLITTVGVAFGVARYRTGSTVPAILMHAAFNLTQFAAFLGTRK